MTKTNKTRSALFTSIISLLLCVSMLVGTTFAWFTDTASSGMNQIIAGNLDVELLYKNGDAYENAADVELFDDIKLWEPGMVVYETVKIANVGNLALKYALEINTGDFNTLNGHGLSEVLHFAVVKGAIPANITRAEALAMAEASADKGMLTSYTFNNQFSLNANAESEPMTLFVYWPQNGELDNLYNANNGQKTNDGNPLYIELGLTVYASQETVEKDSFNEYYDDTASYPQNMWLGDVAEALVIDETTKTISISSGAELAKLAAEVNGGNTFAGYTVKLTDSIDLANIAWTPIGTEDNMLKAEVDGQGHTIYNLNVTGESSVGLFGCTYTDGNNGTSITNVHVVNATVSGNHWVGTIVGKLNYGNLTNCSVKNAKIVVIPDGTEGNYDNGDKVGGIAGFMTEGAWTVSGNKAENVYLKAYRDVGGIVGIAHERNVVEGNEVNDITIVVDQATNAYGDKDFNAGGIYGRKYDSTTVGNNTETSVNISYVVATETALRNAMVKGGNVILSADIAVDADNTITVAEGTIAVLDLNGYTLAAASDESKASSAIANKGELTIKNGTVTYVGVGDPNFGYGTNTINNTGKLVIDGATIINTTANGSSVAIDCSAGADLTINSGEIKSEKNAIRLCPFGSAAINCTINGGTITGARAVQIQLPSNKPTDAPEINLTVNGGTLNGTTGMSIYSYSAGQSFENVKVNLNGGTYNNDVAFGGGTAKTTKEDVSIADSCIFNADVYRYTDTATEYLRSDGKVAEAEELVFALAQGGDVVYTGSDLEIDEALTVTGNLTIDNAEINVNTDDGAGIFVDGGSLTLGEDAVIKVEGTMPDSGVIRLYESTLILNGTKINGCDNKGSGSLINVAYGSELVIGEGTIIENNVITGSTGNTGPALIKVDGTVTMNGGIIRNNQFEYKTLISLERNGKFVMNGGEITGNTYIGSSSASIMLMFMDATVEINGGKIADNDLGTHSYSAAFSNTSRGCKVTVNGGTVTNNMVGSKDQFAYRAGFNPAEIIIGAEANVSGIVINSNGSVDVNTLK